MASLITKLFGIPEEITIGDPRAAQLYRWTIFRNNHVNVSLQHSIGYDWSSDLNAYPSRFLSIGLAQSSVEEASRAHEQFANQAAWMVLIGKPPQSRKNAAHD
jgi:hypothetical protein